jgi:hypothetical protein
MKKFLMTLTILLPLASLASSSGDYDTIYCGKVKEFNPPYKFCIGCTPRPPVKYLEVRDEGAKGPTQQLRLINTADIGTRERLLAASVIDLLIPGKPYCISGKIIPGYEGGEFAEDLDLGGFVKTNNPPRDFRP